MSFSFGDFAKSGTSLGGGYTDPGFNPFNSSPSTSFDLPASGIDWGDIYANPDVLKGVPGGYTDPGFNPFDGSLGDSKFDWNDIDDFIDATKKNKYLDDEKEAVGLPTGVTKGSGSWAQPVSPSVTITGQGDQFGSSQYYRNLAAAGGAGGMMRVAGQNPSLSKILGSGVQSAATNMILGAIPGFGPAFAAANALGVDIPGAVKTVGRFAGDALGGAVKGVSGIFKGIGNLFCDERLKVDIAPLESTEVNDELAQMAFFVKGIRECS